MVEKCVLRGKLEEVAEEIRSAETVYLQMRRKCLQAKANIYCHLICRSQGRRY